MDDLIRRKDALQAIAQLPLSYGVQRDKIITALYEVTAAELPLVMEVDSGHITWRPLMLSGRWEDDCTDIVCSQCGTGYSDEIIFMNRNCEHENLNYCPNCGAKMDGGAEDG